MRYTGPKCRQCRREGVKLFLKGDRCETPKCAVVRRNTVPGAHGPSRSKPTEYARQLREKQKAKRIFGLNETQFANLYMEAAATTQPTADYMMSVLELRADNVLYRSRLVDSRAQARQMINHGLFMINGKKIKTPSIRLRAGDVLSLDPVAKANNYFVSREVNQATTAKWLEVNTKNFSVTVAQMPEKDDFENIVESRLLVEYYSRSYAVSLVWTLPT